MQRTLDLNCDLGEGAGHDTELMPLVSSANIACGGHAGDDATMLRTLRLAQRHDVRVGAHPSFVDREYFGRRELELSADQVVSDVTDQVSRFLTLAQGIGQPVRYLKPHGALYNQACRDGTYAQPVVAVAHRFGLAVMGLPNSALAHAAATGGVPFIAEGFADRRYRPDGSLVPRTQANALLTDPAQAVDQVETLVANGVQSVCVHGDSPHALEFTTMLRRLLLDRGWRIHAVPNV
jgi:UPF0271 protein